MIKYSTDKQINELFRNLGVRLLSRNEITFPAISVTDLSKSSYYRDNRDEFLHLEKVYGKKLKTGCLAALYVAKIDNEIGYGLFAAAPFEPEDFIGEYTGVVQKAATYDSENISTETAYAWDYPDEVPGFPPLEISALTAGSILRFANHSFTPNLRIEHTLVDNSWMIFFVADQSIKKDEQLFLDYGDDYWNMDSGRVVL